MLYTRLPTYVTGLFTESAHLRNRAGSLAVSAVKTWNGRSIAEVVTQPQAVFYGPVLKPDNRVLPIYSYG